MWNEATGMVTIGRMFRAICSTTSGTFETTIAGDHHGSYFSFHWSDWSCGRVILAPYDDYYGISYYYPSYHRKYLFVSLGGYWPYSYRYQRYYWYGCHPYYWYGSDVVTRRRR